MPSPRLPLQSPTINGSIGSPAVAPQLTTPIPILHPSVATRIIPLVGTPIYSSTGTPSFVGLRPIPVQEPPSIQSYPSNVEYPGPYQFEVMFEHVAGTPTKSINWTYSEEVKKLFVRMNTICPIRFKVVGE